MQQNSSPFAIGASYGQPFGLYLSFIFLGMVLSGRIPILGLLSGIALICLPLVIYRTLRSIGRKQTGISASTLSLTGTIMVVCGCFICSIVTMVYLRWFDPTFIVSTIESAVNFYYSIGTPQAIKLAQGYDRMIQQGLVPNSTIFTLTMASFTFMLGALLSTVSSVIIIYFQKRNNQSSRLSATLNQSQQ